MLKRGPIPALIHGLVEYIAGIALIVLPILVDYNGFAQSWAFDDGFLVTRVRTFALDAAVLASINASQELRIKIDHYDSQDLIAFDFFQLDATLAATSVPEPATVALLAGGLLALAGLARRRRG